MPRKQQRRSPATSRSAARSGNNSLRIIAGQWRGRKLPFADQQGLRPTPDRVRETLFNWLQPTIDGARCLDLFSGSGALGLEALSRGAASAILIDSSAAVIDQLRRNLQLLGATNARLVNSSALSWLRQQTAADGSIDLVFLDPPFRKEMLAECCQQLELSGMLSPGARIYVEVEKELKPLPLPPNWLILKHRDTGQLSSYLCCRSDEEYGTES